MSAKGIRYRIQPLVVFDVDKLVSFKITAVEPVKTRVDSANNLFALSTCNLYRYTGPNFTVSRRLE